MSTVAATTGVPHHTHASARAHSSQSTERIWTVDGSETRRTLGSLGFWHGIARGRFSKGWEFTLVAPQNGVLNVTHTAGKEVCLALDLLSVFTEGERGCGGSTDHR